LGLPDALLTLPLTANTTLRQLFVFIDSRYIPQKLDEKNTVLNFYYNLFT